MSTLEELQTFESCRKIIIDRAYDAVMWLQEISQNELKRPN